MHLMIGVLAAIKGNEQSKVIIAVEARINEVQTQMVVTSPIELPPEIRALTQATICCLLIFNTKEIRYVETEATSSRV